MPQIVLDCWVDSLSRKSAFCELSNAIKSVIYDYTNDTFSHIGQVAKWIFITSGSSINQSYHISKLHSIHQYNTSQHLQSFIKSYIFLWKLLQTWSCIFWPIKYSVGCHILHPPFTSIVKCNCAGCFWFCTCFLL